MQVAWSTVLLPKSQFISSIATSLQCIPLRPLQLSLSSGHCHANVLALPQPTLHRACCQPLVCWHFQRPNLLLFLLQSHLDLESIRVSAFFLTTQRLLKCCWRNSTREWSYATPYARFHLSHQGSRTAQLSSSINYWISSAWDICFSFIPLFI